MNRRALLAALPLATAAAAAEPPSLVERLGYPANTRLLNIHIDDIGMSHSANAASIEALTKGIGSSGSVMVPCPWFVEIAQWWKQNSSADLGLHLTLTSEWQRYRWGPTAPRERVPGLLDPEGYLWRSEQDVVKHASPAEVELEIRTQIRRARQFGLEPTHIDSHMGTLFSDPRFFEVYVRVGQEMGVLPMVMEPTVETVAAAKALDIDYPVLAARLKKQSLVLIDRLNTGLKGRTLEERQASFRDVVTGLKPGVTELIVHLSMDDPEIRNITGNWEARFSDYRILMDSEMKRFLEQNGVKLVGYRPLMDLWKKKRT